MSKNENEECGCESSKSGGGPCSTCKPPETWMDEGTIPDEWKDMIPRGWKHMPWDDVELKKHAISKPHDIYEDEFTPDPYVDEQLKKSMKFGEDETSAEMEAWPRVKIFPKDSDGQRSPGSKRSRRRSASGRRSPKPTRPVSVSTSGGEEATKGRKSPSSKLRKERSKRRKADQLQQQKFFIPWNRGGRAKSVEVTVNVRVLLPKRSKTRHSRRGSRNRNRSTASESAETVSEGESKKRQEPANK